MSLYLSLIVSEISACPTNENRKVKDYTVRGVDIEIYQYAGDTPLVWDISRTSFKNCTDKLQIFASYSEIRIDDEKAKVMWFGCPRSTEERCLANLNFE
ncbi:hypothetical protein ElyMa_006507000 [Elysia marginata]|uniref:Uncharacterized protein n=1 Tax=Elysia marginata TaxID=1093978 RepID=A0AAV4I4R7_9GAST|nr:hypothetical protein ElyMa_006507000 [Elysia marginata]